MGKYEEDKGYYDLLKEDISKNSPSPEEMLRRRIRDFEEKCNPNSRASIKELSEIREERNGEVR